MPKATMKITRQSGMGLSNAPGATRAGLKNALTLAAGLVHRHLMSLGRDYPPSNQQGVLPVWSGRLKNSFYATPAEGEGNSLSSSVVSNIIYGARSNERHAFIQATVQGTRSQVNSLIRGELGNSLHG